MIGSTQRIYHTQEYKQIKLHQCTRVGACWSAGDPCWIRCWCAHDPDSRANGQLLCIIFVIDDADLLVALSSSMLVKLSFRQGSVHLLSNQCDTGTPICCRIFWKDVTGCPLLVHAIVGFDITPSTQHSGWRFVLSNHDCSHGKTYWPPFCVFCVFNDVYAYRGHFTRNGIHCSNFTSPETTATDIHTLMVECVVIISLNIRCQNTSCWGSPSTQMVIDVTKSNCSYDRVNQAPRDVIMCQPQVSIRWAILTISIMSRFGFA